MNVNLLQRPEVWKYKDSQEMKNLQGLTLSDEGMDRKETYAKNQKQEKKRWEGERERLAVVFGTNWSVAICKNVQSEGTWLENMIEQEIKLNKNSGEIKPYTRDTLLDNV